jgi:hypothetical protein
MGGCKISEFEVEGADAYFWQRRTGAGDEAKETHDRALYLLSAGGLVRMHACMRSSSHIDSLDLAHMYICAYFSSGYSRHIKP